MIISKSKGEKLSDKDIKSVYGGCSCGGNCGDCDCTDSGGDKFDSSFIPEMRDYDGLLLSPSN